MKVDFDFFKIHSKISPLKGRIMLSEPFLPGNYFSRSAVLLVDYSETGAVGFILNKPIKTHINDLFADFQSTNPELYVGGPVSDDSLFYIHTIGDLIKGSIRIKDNLFWGGDFEELKLAITTGKVTADQVRFFIGYSGWSAGQLETEIAENSWLIAEGNVEEIMKCNQNFWLESVKNAGGHYETWQNFPHDPNSN